MKNPLLPEIPDGRPIGVLFVCLGNICRSPAAEGVFAEIVKSEDAQARFHLDSAGLYGGHADELPDRRMRIHAQRRGYDLTHRSRPVRSSDFDDFDVIVAMDHSNYDRLRALAPTPEDERKVVRMIDFVRDKGGFDCVPDPYYDGAKGFEDVLDLLEDGCRGLYDALTPTD